MRWLSPWVDRRWILMANLSWTRSSILLWNSFRILLILRSCFTFLNFSFCSLKFCLANLIVNSLCLPMLLWRRIEIRKLLLPHVISLAVLILQRILWSYSLVDGVMRCIAHIGCLRKLFIRIMMTWNIFTWVLNILYICFDPVLSPLFVFDRRNHVIIVVDVRYHRTIVILEGHIVAVAREWRLRRMRLMIVIWLDWLLLSRVRHQVRFIIVFESRVV